MLIGNLLSFGGLAVGQQQNERILLELIPGGHRSRQALRIVRAALGRCRFRSAQEDQDRQSAFRQALELLDRFAATGREQRWAVAPKPQRQAGGALLASDPHLEVNRLPALWYEAVLRWDNDWVMGATLPGCPLFAVARTSRLAWGVTYLKGDTSDYFIEDCRRDPHGKLAVPSWRAVARLPRARGEDPPQGRLARAAERLLQRARHARL